MSQKFYNILIGAGLWHIYDTTNAVQTVEGTIMIFESLTHCTLFHFMCDLKATQMNLQYRLFLAVMFELGHNTTAEAIKYFLCKKWKCI